MAFVTAAMGNPPAPDSPHVPNGTIGWRYVEGKDELSGEKTFKEVGEADFAGGFNIVGLAKCIYKIGLEIDFYAYQGDKPVNMNTGSFNESLRIRFDQETPIYYLGHHDSTNQVGVNFMSGHDPSEWNSLPALMNAKSARIELTIAGGMKPVVQIDPQAPSLQKFAKGCHH